MVLQKGSNADTLAAILGAFPIEPPGSSQVPMPTGCLFRAMSPTKARVAEHCIVESQPKRKQSGLCGNLMSNKPFMCVMVRTTLACASWLSPRLLIVAVAAIRQVARKTHPMKGTSSYRWA